MSHCRSASDGDCPPPEPSLAAGSRCLSPLANPPVAVTPATPTSFFTCCVNEVAVERAMTTPISGYAATTAPPDACTCAAASPGNVWAAYSTTYVCAVPELA